MYIKSLVLDGFKSYGKRIEITGFDKEFNAITGLNGSGKSNILDAICFVLGISALGQVRATSLQDLVYKSGQAGIKKAVVTITFDNSNKKASPLGYENYDEIAVTRQIVIDGKNKYLLNGTNVTNQRVQDMFCSVQLNVNNPHFLIMQGRITKVLNMKPMEILSMIEEAAGTRMYEEKKESAMKLIEKKKTKLKEINGILEEEIYPRLTKLREERTQYLEFQRVERELDHCKKVVTAWKYYSTSKTSEKTNAELNEVKANIEAKQLAIENGKEEVEKIESDVQELVQKMEKDKSDKLETMEHELKAVEKIEMKLAAKVNSDKERIKSEVKKIEQLKKDLEDDVQGSEQRRKQLEEFGDKFNKLREAEKEDAAAVVAAQDKYQKISTGLLENENGENATLGQQLMDAKQAVSLAVTEIAKAEMVIKHDREQLKIKQRDFKTTDTDHAQITRELKEKEKHLKDLENRLKGINYVEGSLETLQQQRQQLNQDLRGINDQIDHFLARHPQLRFEYSDPELNFNRKSVKGLVCTLFSLKDRNAAYALEVAAGGKLYNVIVDTEKTSKALLQRGKLQQRVTIIPLNKISGQRIDDATVKRAEQLVGCENVRTALSLIEYPNELSPAMAFIFGSVFICKDLSVAKKVAFDGKIMRKCVTMEGDVCDPSGTLSGGAPASAGSILTKVSEYKVLLDQLEAKEQAMGTADREIRKISPIAERWNKIKGEFTLKDHEVKAAKKLLEVTQHYQLGEEIKQLTEKIQEFEDKIKAAVQSKNKNATWAKELEKQIKNSASIQEQQLKEAKAQLEMLQKKAKDSKKEWEKYESDAQILELQIQEDKKTIANDEEQIKKSQDALAELEQQHAIDLEELQKLHDDIAEKQEKVKSHKSLINQHNKEIQKLIAKKEDIIKQSRDYELDIKKLNHEIAAIKSNASECQQRIKELVRNNPWIEQDKKYFGVPGNMYDFEAQNPAHLMDKLNHLKESRESLSRSVNTRAMNLLASEEERYKDTIAKRTTVENDKKNILYTVQELEEQKKKTLMNAWEQINKDFGSIFSSLLPGANAKLQTLPGKNVLSGLEVKVGFSNVWKESLGELSGGQRSLVALSLILAMLRYKPAPLYILDEVDAALDLSHTQNVGTMLKKHFNNSQFIIVSLKDGMFNNANVLFTTKFVDGMSTISRIEKGKRKKNDRDDSPVR
ncbi:structural maintenance of chromosomes protein 2 [Microplitis mediator]|uniref:structural maintenance of chromosomes protein 2 n=1 Tax=Microplitis mediator TaxID=375433 RepID=UPI0025550CD8|nr:structural maintenance of chromosomes protein 2 [Microplitis mediator]